MCVYLSRDVCVWSMCVCVSEEEYVCVRSMCMYVCLRGDVCVYMGECMNVCV